MALKWRDLMPLLWRDLVPILRVTSLIMPYLLKSYLLISLIDEIFKADVFSVAPAYVIHSKLTYVRSLLQVHLQ